jgi:hypothetical protein
MIIKPNQIDFKKYKRFFTFGCSFTSYLWPTWADVLASEMPNAEFYNFGHCGGGNLLIASRIVETNAKFTFTETDLVIPMWTTFCREDRYTHGRWMNTGNIFNQGEYSEEFVKKYCDPTGYLLRDLAIIELSSNYLRTIVSDSFTMAGVPYEYQMDMTNYTRPRINDILNVYKDTISITPPALVDLELDGEFQHGHIYTRDSNGETCNDYHPHTMNYYNYLKKIGVPLTDRSLEYAARSMNSLVSTKTEKEIHVMFYLMDNTRKEKLRSLF